MGEDFHYEIILPKTSEGFMLRLGASQLLGYHASFASYRRHASGAKSFAETHRLFRNVDDTFIKIDGVDMIGRSFDEVVQFISEKSLRQDSVRVLLLDRRAYEASRANQVSLRAAAPEDTTLAGSTLEPDKATTELILPIEACDQSSPLSKEDEVMLHKATEEDAYGPTGSAKKEKTPPAISFSEGRNPFYDVHLPKTTDGFMFLLNPVPNRRGGGYTTSFYGYHRHQDGSLSKAEENLVFRNIGDILISVNGKDLKGVPPGDVFSIIKGIKDKQNSIQLRLTDVGTSLNKRVSPIRSARVLQKTVTQTWKGQIQGESTANSGISGYYGVNSNELTNEKANRRQSEPASLKKMVENIPAPEPELAGLGWIRQGFARFNDQGHIDRYWTTPVTQKRLRSRVEVSKFLAYLERTEGDEDKAFHLLRQEYSSRRGRRGSAGKFSKGKKSKKISIGDKSVESSQGEGIDKLGELLMEQGVEKDLSDEIAAGATGVENSSSIDSNLCSKKGGALTPSIVPFELEVEDQKIAADVTKEVSSLSAVTNTTNNNKIHATSPEVPTEQVIEDKMITTNIAIETSTLSTVDNAMSNNHNIYSSSPEAPTEQVVEGKATEDDSSQYAVTITGKKNTYSSADVPTEQEVGNDWSQHKITTDGTDVAANMSAGSHTQLGEAASESSSSSKTSKAHVKPSMKDASHETKVGVPEDRVHTDSTMLYSGFEAELSGNFSSLISIDLENVALQLPSKNVTVPTVTAEPVSVCSHRELRKMPVAFAFELEDTESARNAKAAQLLWYSSLLSDSQRQGYIERNVFQGAQRKRNSVSNAPSAAKKQREDESVRRKNNVKHKPSEGTQTKRKIESKVPSTAQSQGKASKRKKINKTPITSSSHSINALLVEDIPAPEPELCGWTRKSYQRKKNKRHIDRYWFTPTAEIRLRSRTECLEFLKHLEDSNGDELKAYESFKIARGLR